MPTLSWYKSKTVWFNVITAAVAIAAGLQGSFQVWAPTLGVIVIVGNIILRVFFTSQPIVTPTVPPPSV